MKKIMGLLTAIVLFLGVSGWAQTWHQATQVTLGWNWNGTYENGTPVPDAEFGGYDVYIRAQNAGPDQGTIYTRVMEKNIFEADITFTQEGRFYLGVAAVRKPPDAEEVKSAIAWSDNPQYVKDGETFGVAHFFRPAPPALLDLKAK